MTVRYEVDEHGRQRPVEIERILISTQHRDGLDAESLIKPDLLEHVVEPVLHAEYRDLFDTAKLGAKDFLYVNPTGKFVIGGPMGDTGLTGRKIIVDTYGGAAPHGGGAFSGKDPTKVDRSAAYAVRHVAKNVVAAGLAQRCQVQVAYAIGVAHPMSVLVDCFGTEAEGLRASGSPSSSARHSTSAPARSCATSSSAGRSTRRRPRTATSAAPTPTSPGSAPTGPTQLREAAGLAPRPPSELAQLDLGRRSARSSRRVRRPLGLDQEDVRLVVRAGAVLDAAGHDEELARPSLTSRRAAGSSADRRPRGTGRPCRRVSARRTRRVFATWSLWPLNEPTMRGWKASSKVASASRGSPCRPRAILGARLARARGDERPACGATSRGRVRCTRARAGREPLEEPSTRAWVSRSRDRLREPSFTGASIAATAPTVLPSRLRSARATCRSQLARSCSRVSPSTRPPRRAAALGADPLAERLACFASACRRRADPLRVCDSLLELRGPLGVSLPAATAASTRAVSVARTRPAAAPA